MTEYDDIINLPHHQSSKHPRMSNYDRAAQFSPFAALSGYDEAVKETARVTEEEIELGEDAVAELNAKIAVLAEHIAEAPQVTVTYFKPDAVKSGGAYLVYTGNIKKIDSYERAIIFKDGLKVSFTRIIELDSEYTDEID